MVRFWHEDRGRGKNRGSGKDRGGVGIRGTCSQLHVAGLWPGIIGDLQIQPRYAEGGAERVGAARHGRPALRWRWGLSPGAARSPCGAYSWRRPTPCRHPAMGKRRAEIEAAAPGEELGGGCAARRGGAAPAHGPFPTPTLPLAPKPPRLPPRPSAPSLTLSLRFASAPLLRSNSTQEVRP